MSDSQAAVAEVATTEHAQQEQPTMGYGIISVSGPFLAQLGISLPADHVTTQGQLRDSGLFAELHTLLLLPETYTIRAMYDRGLSRAWDIGVESADIPVVDEADDLPRLIPTYRRDADGHVELIEIKVEMPGPRPSAEQILRELGFPVRQEAEEEEGA